MFQESPTGDTTVAPAAFSLGVHMDQHLTAKDGTAHGHTATVRRMTEPIGTLHLSRIQSPSGCPDHLRIHASPSSVRPAGRYSQPIHPG